MDKMLSGRCNAVGGRIRSVNWFFLFNPFTWEATDRMIANICSSIERRPRKVFIFYAEPIGHQIILDTGRFQLKKRICKEYADVSYYSYVYESI